MIDLPYSLALLAVFGLSEVEGWKTHAQRQDADYEVGKIASTGAQEALRFACDEMCC
jgi:hypothetical protein